MAYVSGHRWSIWHSWWRFMLRPFYLFASFFRLAFWRPSKALQDQETQLEQDSKTQHQASTVDAFGKPSQYPTVITYRHVRIQSNEEIPKPRPGEVIYVAKGEFLTKGGTAIVERLSSGEVMKTPTPNPFSPAEEEDCRRNMRLEARVYQKLGQHPRVPRYVQWDPDTCCLTMEYLENGNLREYIRRNGESVTAELRLRWATQAAEGLHVLHHHGVIHCDISPRNFLLDAGLNLKISDFAGSSLSGSEPAAFANTRYRIPHCNWDSPPCIEDDMFGLGSLIYFIMTNSYPYEEVPSDEVERLYRHQHFPTVADLPCGWIIERCWRQQVNAAEVYDCLKTIR